MEIGINIELKNKTTFIIIISLNNHAPTVNRYMKRHFMNSYWREFLLETSQTQGFGNDERNEEKSEPNWF